MVFVMCGCVYFIGFLIYSLLGSVEMEPWAVAKDQNEDDTPVEKFADAKDIRI
jgi:hypothetical protein